MEKNNNEEESGLILIWFGVVRFKGLTRTNMYITFHTYESWWPCVLLHSFEQPKNRIKPNMILIKHKPFGIIVQERERERVHMKYSKLKEN